MRYVTATVGAILIFAGVVLASIFVNWYLPPVLKFRLGVRFGSFFLWLYPAIWVGIIAGFLAAIYSFRSTLKVHAAKAEKKALANQAKQPISD